MVNRIQLIVLLLVLFRLPLVGATGDVVGGEILTNGWTLRLAIEGYNTNGQFNFGWLTNNTGTSRISLTCDSQGYTTNGIATTRQRTIYGTKQLRSPYGTNGQSTANYVVSMFTNNGRLFIDIGMSQVIFQPDVNVLGYASANLYSNNAANSGFVITNSSTQRYPKVIGKFNDANWQRVTNNSLSLRCHAYNLFGTNYSPVACVQFRSTDASGDSVTNTVTQMTLTPSSWGNAPIPEYKSTLDVSTLTQGDIATNNFTAYPYIGDSDSVLNTGDGLWSTGQPYYSPRYFLLDQTNLYGTAYAYVNGTNGTANGVVLNNSFDQSSPPAAFFSISQAASAIAKSNQIWFGRSNVAGAFIIVRGTNSWTGTSGAPPSTRGNTFLTVRGWSGDTDASIINGQGSGNINGLVKLENLSIKANEGSTFAGGSNLWFNNVTFYVTNSATNLIDGNGVFWMEGGRVVAFDQSFKQQGSQIQVWEMVRDVWFGDTNGFCFLRPVHPYNFIGNTVSVTNQQVQFINTLLTGIPWSAQNIVIGYNRFLRLNYFSITYASIYGGSLNCSNGAVIVQNIFESVNTNDGDGLLLIHGDSAQGNVTNIMYWQNTTAGAKCSLFYDDLGTSPHWVVNCSFYGNLHSDFNIKSDTFSGSSLNGGRIGNWAMLYGVFCRSSGHMEYGAGAPGSFLPEFSGLGCYQPGIGTTQPPQGATNNFGYASYINDQSWDGLPVTAIPAGLGDYRLQPSSPILLVTNNIPLIGWDIMGTPRSRNVAGAYEAQQVTYLNSASTTTLSTNSTTFITP